MIQPNPAPQRKHQGCFPLPWFTHHLWLLHSKEHCFWRWSETRSSASKQVFGNLPQGFLFPCSLGVPVGQHTSKMTINTTHQWAELATAGGEGFYGKDLGISLPH